MTNQHSKQIAEFIKEFCQYDQREDLEFLSDYELRKGGVPIAEAVRMWLSEALQTAERRGEERERERIANLIDFDMEEVCLKTGCVNNKQDFLASIKPTSDVNKLPKLVTIDGEDVNKPISKGSISDCCRAGCKFNRYTKEEQKLIKKIWGGDEKGWYTCTKCLHKCTPIKPTSENNTYEDGYADGLVAGQMSERVKHGNK